MVDPPPANLRCGPGEAFIDRATLWLINPLSKEQLKALRQRCGFRKLHVSRRKPFPHWPYEQRLQICQPKRDVLEIFLHRNDVLLNYVEIALDLTFDSEDERDEAYKFICQHIVKDHHRDQKVKFVGKEGATRYSAPRNSPNVLVIYRDRASKVTGEVFCVHVEWRIKGRPALKRQQFESLADLVNIEFFAFWQKRLRLHAVNRQKLGRKHNNYFRKTNRRGNWVKRWGRLEIDFDLRSGGLLMRLHGSVQTLIDEVRFIDVRGCLTPIPVEHLLPTQNQGKDQLE
jgi:hypothetical protein